MVRMKNRCISIKHSEVVYKKYSTQNNAVEREGYGESNYTQKKRENKEWGKKNSENFRKIRMFLKELVLLVKVRSKSVHS